MSDPDMPRRPEEEVMNIAAEAEAYARADFGEVNEAFVERLLDVVGLLDVAKAVDLGTGPADIPIRVLRYRPRWHVTAVDASGEMLQWARLNVEKAVMADAIDLVRLDAKDTGLPEAAFDVVFSNSILHHITAAAPRLTTTGVKMIVLRKTEPLRTAFSMTATRSERIT